MSILQLSLSISKPPPPTTIFKPTPIRMGGGPRTFPGGVSKWQWKRMQQKKSKQLLKARLARERQIYEMRKRAELKAAVSELERPWEVVSKGPTLFSVSADEQVKVLADRFQRPGGFDLWSEKDGPQLFETFDGVPSARFFPKGVVHSIKPYRKISEKFDNFDELGDSGAGRVDLETEPGGKMRRTRNGSGRKSRNPDVFEELGNSRPDSDPDLETELGGNMRRRNGSGRKSRNSAVFDEFGGPGQVYADFESEPGGRMRVNRNGFDRKSRNSAVFYEYSSPKSCLGPGLGPVTGTGGKIGVSRNVDDFGVQYSGLLNEGKSGKGKFRKNGNRRRYCSDSDMLDSGEGEVY